MALGCRFSCMLEALSTSNTTTALTPTQGNSLGSQKVRYVINFMYFLYFTVSCSSIDAQDWGIMSMSVHHELLIKKHIALVVITVEYVVRCPVIVESYQVYKDIGKSLWNWIQHCSLWPLESWFDSGVHPICFRGTGQWPAGCWESGAAWDAVVASPGYHLLYLTSRKHCLWPLIHGGSFQLPYLLLCPIKSAEHRPLINMHFVQKSNI